MKNKRLYRVEEDSKLFGVCGGIAEYFEIDPTIVRLIWVLAIFCCGVGVLLYLACALVMPKKSEVVKVTKKGKKSKDEK